MFVALVAKHIAEQHEKRRDRNAKIFRAAYQVAHEDSKPDKYRPQPRHQKRKPHRSKRRKKRQHKVRRQYSDVGQHFAEFAGRGKHFQRFPHSFVNPEKPPLIPAIKSDVESMNK